VNVTDEAYAPIALGTEAERNDPRIPNGPLLAAYIPILLDSAISIDC
jgi:hypothetical protein